MKIRVIRMKFERDDRVVFIGDSITESGRFTDAENIGDGYVRLIHDYAVTAFPEQRPQMLNRGISGNRIPDLASRWETDVLVLKPDFVSVSIGINDVWRQLDRPGIEQVDPARFENIYTRLSSEVKNETEAQLILMEPTIIEEMPDAEGNKKLIPYVETVRELAERFDAVLVPTHQVFIDYLKLSAGRALTTDGVHMNSAGNMLMARTWLKAFRNA